MPINKKNKKKQLNKYLTLTSIPFQMGITIYLGSEIGKFIDTKCNFEKPFFLVFMILISMSVSLYSVIKQLNRINNEK